MEKVSQKEYLKRYLSKDDGKKKRKKNKTGPKTVQIIDDDIDLQKLSNTFDDEEISIFNTTEDAPQIVGVIDERGPVDFYNKQRWKVIADDGTGDITITKIDKTKVNTSCTKTDEISSSSKKSLIHGKKQNSSDTRSETENTDSDFSPRRSNKSRESRKSRQNKVSGRKRTASSDSDLSPPRPNTKGESRERRQNRHTGRKRTKSSDSDLSPPRPHKQNKNLPRQSKWDQSYGEEENRYFEKDRKRRNADSDFSPPRQTDKSYKDRQSKYSEKRQRQNSDSDFSPPRQTDKSYKNRQSKYSEKRQRQNSDSDFSPPRQTDKSFKDRQSKHSEKRQRQNGDSDFSPPRQTDKSFKDRQSKHSEKRQRQNSDSDFSPPRQNKKTKSHNNTEDRFSKKNKRDSDSDVSPPRQSRKEYIQNKYNEFDISCKNSKNEKNNDKDIKNNKRKKTLDGTSAGLQNLKSLKEEEEAQKRREAVMMKNMSNEISGHGQSVVLRDRKTGRKRDLQKEAAEKLEKQKAQNEVDAIYAKWGKGLKQMEDREDKLKSDLREMSKPLARYANDQDLENELRARERDMRDDPMLAYIREKEIKEGKRAPGKPKYEGSFMPNRYGIKPGYRWDGVDRSNGYEKKWFEAQNARKAGEDEAFKWSTADM